MSNRRQAAKKEQDGQRVPMGGMRTNLQLSPDDLKGFRSRRKVPRWINDRDGRLQAAINGGYDYVHPDHCRSIGGDIEGPNAEGGDSRVSKVVSRGGDRIVAYLMEIDQSFYDEDLEAKHAQTMKVDEALRPVDQGGQSIEGGYTPK